VFSCGLRNVWGLVVKFSLRTDDGLLPISDKVTEQDVRRWFREDFTDREKYEILTGKIVPDGTAFVSDEETDAGNGDMPM